jgi:DNA-binding transcriptional ArsR family regulator
MNREDPMAVGLHITAVALIVMLAFSSGACAVAVGHSYEGVDRSHEGDQIDLLYKCVPVSEMNSFSAFRFSSVSFGTDSLTDHSRLIEIAASDLVEDLSGSGGDVFLPVGSILLRYSRYDDSDPLDNDVRQQVYKVIEQSPGTYISEVSDVCDATRSTIRYHVRILEEEDLIVGETVRGKHRFHPVGSDDPALAAALNDDATARVLGAIARLEPVTVSTLADDLDRSPGTVSYHLDRLTNDDLLEREQVGNAVVTRLASDISTEMLDGDIAVSPAD